MRYTRRFVLIWIGCASGLSLLPRHAEARALRATPDELAARRHRLEARVRAEFASGTTVQLDGWVLSRTEARLCALSR